MTYSTLREKGHTDESARHAYIAARVEKLGAIDMTKHKAAILAAMKQYGTRFESDLAQAWKSADEREDAALRKAFPELVVLFGRFAEHDARSAK